MIVQTVSDIIHEIYRGINCNLANAKYVLSRKHVFNAPILSVHKTGILNFRLSGAPVGMGA